MDRRQTAWLGLPAGVGIFLIARAVGGTMMFLAQIAFAWNVYRTVTAGQQISADEEMAMYR